MTDDERIELNDCVCHWCIGERTTRQRNNGVSWEHLGVGTFMVLCPTCGNKRCPKASAHWLECTRSNDPGQLGSSYGEGMPEPLIQLRPSLAEHDRITSEWLGQRLTEARATRAETQPDRPAGESA